MSKKTVPVTVAVTLAVPRATATGPQNAGEEIEVSPAEAKRMARAGQCRPLSKEAQAGVAAYEAEAAAQAEADATKETAQAVTGAKETR